MREFLSAFVDPMFKVAFYSALGLFISSVVFLLILSVTIVENDKLKNDNEKLILEMKKMSVQRDILLYKQMEFVRK